MARQPIPAASSATERAKLPLLELGLVLALLAIYPSVPLGVNSAIIWACLLLQYGLMVSSILRPVTLYRGIPTFISAEFLFLFFSYLIFFYPYQLHVLGIFGVSESRYFPGHTFPDQTNQAIVLSIIAMVSFRAGVRALGVSSTTSDEPDRGAIRLDTVSSHQIALPVLTLQAVLILCYQIFGWRAEAEGRYTGTTSGGTFAEVIYTGITVLCMVAIAVYVYPAPKHEPRRPVFLTLSVILSIIWAIRILIAGDRNGFLLIAIVAIGGVLTFRFRAGRWALVALCGIALTMYNVIEQFRKGQIDSLFGFFLGEGASHASTADADTSFNISTISVRAALADVPALYDYGYGLYKLVGLAGIVPFIRGVLIPPEIVYTQSSDVMVMILLGPSATWGVGTNIIVDIYMDFGIAGVPILLFALGVGVAYTQRAIVRRPDSLWRAVFYLITLALAAELPRYSLAFPARPLVWVVLLFWAVYLLSPSISPTRPKLQRANLINSQAPGYIAGTSATQQRGP